MDRLPAFQFYPSDWKEDIGVQALNFEDRGIWFEILLIMHVSEERGKLIINGEPMSDEMVARLIGISLKKYKKTKEKLLKLGVAKVENSIVYNKRMVKDEYIRKVRKEAGSKGGNPNLTGDFAKPNLNQTDNQSTNQTEEQNPTPSSSSSFTSSSSSYTDNTYGAQIENQQQAPKRNTGTKPKTIFVPPTPEEVLQAFKEKKNGVWSDEDITWQAEKFVLHYTEAEWKISGGKKMKDWKLSVAKWVLNNYDKVETVQQTHQSKMVW